MIEKLADLLTIFLEKYLVPTVIAIIMSFVTYYFIGDSNPFLVKFKITGFLIFTFCIWFLIIYFLIQIVKYIIKGISWIIKSVKNYFEEKKSKLQQEQAEKEEEAKVLEILWSSVDSLSSDEYKLLLNFIDTENKPYCEEGTRIGSRLFSYNWFYKTEITPAKQIPIKVNRNDTKGMIAFSAHETVSATYGYILKDEIYQLIKYSLEKYGKISHFDNKQ